MRFRQKSKRGKAGKLTCLDLSVVCMSARKLTHAVRTGLKRMKITIAVIAESFKTHE